MASSIAKRLASLEKATSSTRRRFDWEAYPQQWMDNLIELAEQHHDRPEHVLNEMKTRHGQPDAAGVELIEAVCSIYARI